MVGLGDGTRLLLITFACIAQARPGVEKRSAQPGYYPGSAGGYKGGGAGEEIDGGFKFTDDTILPGFSKDAELGTYQKSSNELDIPHVDLEEHLASMESEKATIGSGFHDIGPKDVGQEIFAKMEEAAQHAMTIIEGAQKFTEEAAKEQEIKGDSNKAYKEQLALSPNDVHLPSDQGSAAAPSAAPSAAPAAAPMAPAQPAPPVGGQPAPPASGAEAKPY